MMALSGRNEVAHIEKVQVCGAYIIQQDQQMKIRGIGMVNALRFITALVEMTITLKVVLKILKVRTRV